MIEPLSVNIIKDYTSKVSVGTTGLYIDIAFWNILLQAHAQHGGILKIHKSKSKFLLNYDF